MRTILVSGALLLALVLSLFSTGCATKPKVDWNSRVGGYTYDQAVVELGPPDRQATLTDGRRVGEWVVGRSGGGGLSIGVGSFGRHTGVGVSQSIGSGPQDRILRLTFDTQGKLTEWAQN